MKKPNLHNTYLYGIQTLQAWGDLRVWEALLNQHPDIQDVIELGTYRGGLSLFFKAQAIERTQGFYTFDRNRPAALDRPLAQCLGLERDFIEGNIWSETRDELLSLLHDHRRKVLFVDGGDKPREFRELVPELQEGDYVAVHDCGIEFMPSDADSVLHLLEEIQIAGFSSSLTRFWRRISPHTKPKEPLNAHRLKVIVSGAGRSGTQFMARFLTSAGIQCGWEQFFDWRGLDHARRVLCNRWPNTIAESSWCAAPFLGDDILSQALVIHLIRHPREVIGSLLKTWTPKQAHTPFTRFAMNQCESLVKWEDDRVTWAAAWWLRWNEMLEVAKACRRDSVTFKIEGDPKDLLRRLQARDIIGDVDEGQLFDNRKANAVIKGPPYPVRLRDIDESVRVPMLELARLYGYEWEESAKITVSGPPVIKAVITTLDNQPTNVEQLNVLQGEPIDEIIFVNNGSIDNTRQWLDQQDGITVIHRENLGAGPGRNAGIDAAGEFDYLFTLDGGIRPLRGGTQRMLDYMERHKEADVLGVEIADFEMNYDKAWRRWPEHLSCEGHAYQNNRLSHTAYALSKARAWDGLRFCEDGPFGEPGWGADDNEMAYQWMEVGVVVHVLTCQCKHSKACSGVHPYRHASGSFRRIEKETGIWPTNYGSVYERRVLWTEHNWPQHDPGVQWGEPWLTLVIRALPSVGSTAKRIKLAHDLLRGRMFARPWHAQPNPYNVILWMPDAVPQLEKWAEEHCLRRHWGHTVLRDNGETIRRDESNEETWTGDFRIWRGDDWRESIRPNAHYYALVREYADIGAIMGQYNAIHPHKSIKSPPEERREICPRP